MNLLTDYARAINAERRKLPGSRAMSTALAGPVIVMLITLLGAIFGADPSDGAPGWVDFVEGVLMFYVMLLLPVLGAMVGAQLGAIEHNADAWKGVYAQPAMRSALPFAKLILGQALLLGSLLVAAFGSIAVGVIVSLFTDVNMHPWDDAAGVLTLCLKLWAASWLAMTIHVYAGLWLRRTMLAVGIGLLGMFASFMGMINGISHVQYSPWFLPLNLMNDGSIVPDEADPLTLTTTLIISVTGSLIVAALGTLMLTRRDVP